MADQSELDQLATAELQRLQRQHRGLQLDLRGLLEEKAKRLKKQNHMINVLQVEHQKLKEEIKTLEGGTHARKNTNRERHLGTLQEQQADLQKVLQNERTNLWELEGHIRKMEKEIDALRRNEVPDNCYKDSICKVQKSVVKLENRLDVVNKKCSDVLTENSKMRDAINHMLQDRANFNDMWQSMVTQFNEGKKFIMDLIDQSTLAFDQREELCNKLTVLKDRNENDKVMHIQEMREMQRRLEHDAKLQKFFDIKGQKRLNPELEQRELDKKQSQKETYEKQLLEYKEIIEKIKLLYGEEDADRLVAQFKRQEDENFALFNYVNELSHEVEVLNDSTQELQDEIERQKSEQTEKELKLKTEALDYLNAEKERIEQLAEETREKKRTLSIRLEQLLKGIEDIFRQLACDDAPILNVLSTKTFLTVHNVKLFIGVIERRVNLIISAINIEDNSNKILARKDRVPKFNIRESAKTKN
ncbi:coiled-coil domain-containing protein 63 [Drosophila santomea]|uniref:coiled-coil domain-containing protein 63 n=1 Tax=Drosophila santomea TaxID=129105 RepID=UPI0019542F3A|nr:coiled-coil domain-containing protein 63 [Drosophila santomea]XP_039489784.1 coiled-coil domain-containing protein 63 [Drosophila santomea]